MCLKGDRLIKLTTEVQFQQGLEGGMFMDLPEDLSYQDIVKMAQNRKLWKTLSINLGHLDTPAMRQCIQDFEEADSDSDTTANFTPSRALPHLLP